MFIPAKLRGHRGLRNLLINISYLIGGLAVYTQRLDLWVKAFLLLNTYAFIIFFMDKTNAKRKGHFRVPESSFLLVAACGGGVGTFLGMITLRHKTKHMKFRLALPFLLLTSMAIFIFGYWYIAG